MNSGQMNVYSKQFCFYMFDGTVERIVEHCKTIVSENARYFIVKIEKRPYNETIDLKLLNDLWEIRGNFIIKGEWYDRLYDDEGRVMFSVFTCNRYWEIVYKHQGNRYPKPRKQKSKVWRNRICRKGFK